MPYVKMPRGRVRKFSYTRRGYRLASLLKRRLRRRSRRKRRYY